MNSPIDQSRKWNSLFVNLLPMFSKPLSIRMPLRSSGSTEALDVLRPAQQLFGIGTCTTLLLSSKSWKWRKNIESILNGTPTLTIHPIVEWNFEDRAERGTYVSVVHSGFDMEAEDFIEQIVDSTGGFALVLAAAKVYLEHGIELNIVADRF